VTGDRGSSYAIARSALQSGLRKHEAEHSSIDECSDECLLKAIMIQLQLESLENLTDWAQSATKSVFSSIAPLILQKWTNDTESIASDVVNSAVSILAEDCNSLIKKLKRNQSGTSAANIHIGFTGSLFTKNVKFVDAVSNKIKSLWNDSNCQLSFQILEETVYGALKMIDGFGIINEQNRSAEDDEQIMGSKILPILLGLPETELRNKNSMNLHTMGTQAAFDLMIDEESSVYKEIRSQKENICLLVEKVAAAFQNGGRLFYVGSGTSGRLGILVMLINLLLCIKKFKYLLL